MIHRSLPNNVLAPMSCGELFRSTVWYDIVKRALCEKSGSGILRQLFQRIETRDLLANTVPEVTENSARHSGSEHRKRRRRTLYGSMQPQRGQ